MGRLLIGIGIMFLLFATSTMLWACSEESKGEPPDPNCSTEWQCVKLAVAAMMADPASPILDLETDKRIISFASCEAEATRDMTDGGLIDFEDRYIESGSVSPPSEYFGRQDQTEHRYWVEKDGTVHQVYLAPSVPLGAPTGGSASNTMICLL